MQGPIPISFELLFPHGCYVVGEVTAAKDFDAKRDTQAKDKATGLPIWQVPVMDADPSLKAAQKTVTVKILAEVQPVVPPSLPGVPLAPAEFEGLEVKPYVHQATGRLAYSRQSAATSARREHAPRTAPATPTGARSVRAAASSFGNARAGAV
ncbi:plasmid replication, integration and excision activator [Microbispora sp. NEAU-D428]|uniref:plasmid replication, integration and excision activator n=1 Tax=Microbispora sitophila TaxID=2771537 RepID=UPI001866629F|nr:plasmid replication, integration and excision activator [Microbispora sitophila]MBE3008359.1 plasmid replication, integration and excision activator [Microbispora sitophila]